MNSQGRFTMNINKKVKMAVAAVVIAACAFGGYQYYQTKQAEAQAAAVETAKVVRMNLKSTVSATGTIKPVNSVEVSPKITARISQILVKENDHVTAGQTVAILDGKDYQPSATRPSSALPIRCENITVPRSCTQSEPIRSSLGQRRIQLRYGCQPAQ